MDAMGALGLGIILTLKDNASAAMDKIKAKLTGLKGVSKETVESFTAGAKRMLLGAGLMTGGALLLTKALGGPISAAIEFQSVMADVNKVANFSAQEYGEMSAALVDMSKRIPVTAAGLGEIMAAAAQAGIAKEDLVAFTEDAAKMGVAFDISAQEAGDAMAGLRSIFQIGQQDVVLLGDAVNHLANNMNATAGNILNFLNRAGSIGKMAGMTQQQIAALGATFIDLKTPPEIAARAFNALAMKLTNASNSSGPAGEAFKALGLSGEQMERQFKQNATGAIMTLLDAVKKSSNPIAHLRDIVGEGFADDIAKLADGNEKLRSALGLVGDESKYAGSMLAEYETRAGTVKNALQLLANRIEAVKIRLGGISLPIFGKLVDLVSAVVGWASRLPAPIYAAVAAVTGLTGAFLLGFGALTLFGGFLKILPVALALTKAGLVAVRGAMVAARGAFLSAAMPVLALVALAYVFRAAWKANFGGIREAATAIAAGFRMAASASEDGIAKVDAAVAKKLKDAGLWDLAVMMGRVFFRVRVFLRGLMSGFRQTWEGLRAMAAAVWDFFFPAIETGRGLLKDLGLIKDAADTNSKSWESWGEMIGRWGPVILGAAAAIWAVVKVVKAAKAAVAAFNFVVSLNPIGIVVMAVVALIAFMIYRWDVFGEHIKALWQGITGMISGVFAFLKGLVQIVVGIFTGDFEKIGEGFRNVFNGLKTFFLGWADVILGKIGLVTAPVKWLLEKMGILEKDSGKALAKQIEGLNAPEETKKRLLGQAAGLSPEAAANVAAGFSGMKPGFQDAKFMEALMKNEAALAPPPIDTAGAPAMDGASGAPTAAPLAGPSVAPLAAAQAARTDVAVAVVPQSEVVIKIGEEPVGRAAMRFAAHQEVRRGRGEAAYG